MHCPLCWGQTTRYFCLLKCSLCQIKGLKSHKFLLRDMTDMLLPDQSSFAVHDMHDVTSKEALATDCYYWQAVVGGKQKIEHADLSVETSWGFPDAVSVVHYDTLREMKRLIVERDAHWSFPSLSDALRLPGWAIVGLISCIMSVPSINCQSKI